LRSYPALDVTGADADLVMAVVDDFAPSAVDEHDDTLTVYFSDDSLRDQARQAVGRAFPAASLSTREVPDEDWARRSQESLQPITVGRVTVAPPWAVGTAVAARPQPPAPGPELHLRPLAPNPQPLEIVILPSMGFGTGHHSTTRLCLAALQTLDLADRDVLDVGTGSGVLAIAARMLGARTALGFDYDSDAIQSANENLALNPSADSVRFRTIDLRAEPLSPADVVTANLTGTLLVESAALLIAAIRPGGSLIVSGLQVHERPAVERALAGLRLAWSDEESEWMGLLFNRPAVPPV
jgi:ribosomal protein L11 methyltransferase